MAGINPLAQFEQAATEEEERLKYLHFVQSAILRAVQCASKGYGFAKDISGPLKIGVETVEGAVKTVVGPFYPMFRGFHFEVLKFVDGKVDKSVKKLDTHVPPLVKQVSAHAMTAAQQAPKVARTVISGVKSAGLVETAKTAYTKCEPAAQQVAASTWQSLNQLPLVPSVAKVVVPTAAQLSEKYNQAVNKTAEKGYKVSSFLPLVPTEKIAKVFGGEEQAQPSS